LLWAAKRGLGIDYPFQVTKAGHELRKPDWVGEFPNSSVELQAIRSKGLFQKSEELATKQMAKRWVEKKVRQHLMRARGRKGFGWKRWSV
jgi:hypothetical protein